MSPPSKRFKPIQRIASDKERKAAAALGDSLRSRQEAEQRLDELQRYHAEYMERYRDTVAAGATAATFRDYQVFLDKLEQAIREQQRVVEQAAAQCARSKDEWRDRHAHTKAMDNAVDRMRQRERQADDKREQNAQDDRNQRKR
jgi:flagellar FliJ protein